ncbi:MAG: SEL1-like repeat protein [Candidatus Puniceispirillaceae bacterium]|jgi:TPR repeat protein
MARWSKKWARLPFLTALLLAVAGGGATAQEPLESLDSLVESLFVLGENYEAGDWVRQSDLLAYMWYLLAATAGHDTADSARHRMATRLSAAEIAAAQALARQCHATDYWQCGSSDPADTNAGMIATTDVTANTIAPTHTQGNLPAAQ